MDQFAPTIYAAAVLLPLASFVAHPAVRQAARPSSPPGSPPARSSARRALVPRPSASGSSTISRRVHHGARSRRSRSASTATSIRHEHEARPKPRSRRAQAQTAQLPRLPLRRLGPGRWHSEASGRACSRGRAATHARSCGEHAEPSPSTPASTTRSASSARCG